MPKINANRFSLAFEESRERFLRDTEEYTQSRRAAYADKRYGKALTYSLLKLFAWFCYGIDNVGLSLRLGLKLLYELIDCFLEAVFRLAVLAMSMSLIFWAFVRVYNWLFQ